MPAQPLALEDLADLSSLFDDDDEDGGLDFDEDITVVGKMSEEMKALRQGYRKKDPVPGDDLPDIEIHGEADVDVLLVEELLFDEQESDEQKIAVRAYGATDRGRRRKVNQDAVLVMPPEAVYLIADGMGGHVAGEVASALAAEVVETAVRDRRFDGEPNLLWPVLGDELARAVEMANTRIFNEATASSLDGMGTTVTAARFSLTRQRLYIAHVGDSRCYRVRRGRIDQLTEDHTVANLMGVDGPLGAQLSRAVGVEPIIEVDLLVDIPEIGDRYLLCTDGLNKMLPDDAILAVLEQHPGVASAVEALIEHANYLGGRDNIGIALLEIEPPQRATIAPAR